MSFSDLSLLGDAWGDEVLHFFIICVLLWVAAIFLIGVFLNSILAAVFRIIKRPEWQPDKEVVNAIRTLLYLSNGILILISFLLALQALEYDFGVIMDIWDNEVYRFIITFSLWIAAAFLISFFLDTILTNVFRIIRRPEWQSNKEVVNAIRIPLLLLIVFKGFTVCQVHLDGYEQQLSTLVTIFNALIAIISIVIVYRIYQLVIIPLLRNIVARFDIGEILPLIEYFCIGIIILIGTLLVIKALGFDFGVLMTVWENEIYHFTISFLLWVGAAVLISLFLDFILITAFRVIKRPEWQFDKEVVNAIRKPLLILVIIKGFTESQIHLDSYKQQLSSSVTLFNAIIPLISIIIAYRIFKMVIMPLFREMTARSEADMDEISPLLDFIGTFIIILIGTSFVLSALGINIGVLMAGVGIIGLVIAFAAQDTLSNFFSGIHLIIDRPFREGDTILHDGEVCTVKHIGLRSCKLYNRLKHTWIVAPNNSFASNQIINLSQPDTNYRMRIAVGVSYDSNPEEVERLLLEVAKAHPKVIQDDFSRGPNVFFDDFGASSLDFSLIVWIRNVLTKRQVSSDLRKAILSTFHEHSIVIPFPQSVLHFPSREDDTPPTEVVEGF